MKEFKFCGEITEYVEIPVYVCETQKEMVKEISEIRDVLTFVDEARENLLDTAVSNEEETSVYIIYKDGSIYFKTLDEEEGKFKRYGIKAAVIETAFEYTVYGDFAVTDNGDISIEGSDIEEYGVYAGQYDVKEQTEETAPEAAETAEEAEQEETKMKKYYFISEIRGIVGEHSGNIRGAKAKAQKFAEQFDEEITILVRSNKEIDCGKNIPANEEVCRVCNADGDVLAVCSTYGNAFAWCAENGIEGEIGEYEPYIEVGTYSENGNFEVEDYSSINTGDGMWNIINDYCYYFDKVCPEATAETVESVEETTVSETETAEQETVEGISKMEITTETGDSGFEYTRSQAQEIIMTGTSIAREKYREKHNIHSPMDLKKFSKKQLDDYLSKELDYINKFLNDTIPKEVFNAMKGEIMYA